ncbi:MULTISPECIES: hypothetical protein [Bremerella]|uniref:hypothetical protein n=1 Tax=Bremerella TaxID=2714594 RepID=UPI0031EB30C8
MNAVETMLYALVWVIAIVNFICFFYVILKMFQNNDVGLALISLLLTPCSGLGMLIVFIAGWAYVVRYDTFRFMAFWSLLSFSQLLFAIAYVLLEIQQHGQLPMIAGAD